MSEKQKTMKRLINDVVRFARENQWDYSDSADFIRLVRQKIGLKTRSVVHLPKIPPQEEDRKFYEAIQNLENFFPAKSNLSSVDIFQAEQRRLFFNLLYITGLRVSEAANLRWDQFDLEKKIIIVRHGKGDKDRVVIFSDEFRTRYLEPYHQKLKGQFRNIEFLFPNPETGRIYSVRYWELRFQKFCRKMNIQSRFTPHTLRHIFLTKIAKINPVYAQQLAGHSRIDTTMVYTHLNIDDLRGAYDQIFQGRR